jgi:hypothetical protein
LDSLNWLPWLSLCDLYIGSTGKIIHTNKLSCESIEYWGEFARGRVVVVLRVVGGDDIHVTLEETASLLGVICSIDPGIIANRHTWGQLQLSYLRLDSGMAQTQLLNFDELVCIDGGLRRSA